MTPSVQQGEAEADDLVARLSASKYEYSSVEKRALMFLTYHALNPEKPELTAAQAKSLIDILARHEGQRREAAAEITRLRAALAYDPNVLLIAHEDGDHQRLSRALSAALLRAEAAESSLSQCRDALAKLLAEVGGLSAFEEGVRAVISNTNWSVLQLRATEARAILSPEPGTLK